MEALLYFAFWAALIFLMMRFGCGAHVMGRGRKSQHGHRAEDTESGRELRWIPPETDVDPVCGKTVATDTAKPSVFDGTVYYFCSRECRELFETAPKLYGDGQSAAPRRLEHSHG